MSELVPPSADVKMTDQPVPQPSAGALLRKGREAAGLHIAALAVSLRVPVKKLEALEADRLDLLPDAVFVRALASSVCRSLKIDPGPVLERLPQTAVPRLKPDELGINAPFRAAGDSPGSSMWDQLSRPVVLTALALLCAALVLIFFPTMNQTEVVTVTASDAVVSVPVATPASTPVSMTVGAVGESGASTPPPVQIQQPAPSTVLGQAPASTAPPAAVQAGERQDPIASATVPGVNVSTGDVVFKTRGASWVEVTDAKGVIQLRRIIVPGETVGASGALPLSVVVGRADATDVLVRGKPFSLANLAKDNVARFEVK